MPLVVADRVRETTTTTGTGTITLAGAVTGFRSFSVIGNANTTYYTIAGQNTSEWEVGIGTYTAAGTTLSRDTVLASSAGAPTKTTFSAGTKDVFVTYPADRSVYVDGSTVDTSGLGAVQGDILYASAANTFSLLVKNTTATRYLSNTGTTNNPAWAQVNLADGVTGTLPIGNGGTGQTTASAGFNALSPITTLGDIIYGSGANSAARLAGNTTTTKQFLTQTGTGTVSAAPAWGTIAIGDVPTITVAKGGLNLTSIAALSIPVANTANTYTTVTPAAGQSIRVNAGNTAWEAYTPGTGTVTGVTGTSPVASSGGATPAISLSAAYGDTLNPYGSKTAAQVLAAPAAAAGVPSFRALVAGDLPTVTVAKGGTGLTTIAARSIPVSNTADTYTTVTPAAGQSIRINAGNTAWEAYTPAATPLGVTVGGTGLTSIAARSIFVVNTANTGTTVTPAAGQSIRINAGNTAWEAYTPGTGTVTSVAAGNGMSFTTFTTSGSIVMGTPSTINDVSTNSVSAGTHSHSIAVASTLQGGIVTVGNQSWSGTKTLSGVLCTAFNYASTTSTYVTGSEINHDIAASTRHRIAATNVRPGSDNAQTSGASGTRWSAVWAATGTIQTSDATTKRDIAPLDEAEKAVAIGIKGLIKKYRFIDAYEKKGEAARIHIGVIAQDLEQLFIAHGLDASRYALWCSDTWWEREEQVFMGEANGYKMDLVQYDYEVEGATKRHRLAVRYDQLLAFLLAAL